MINIFIAMLGIGLVIPILPKFIIEFGASGKDMGYLLAAMGITQFLFSPLGGEFSDKYGRKLATLLGMAVLAISQIMFSFGTELWMLYLSRVIGGIGLGFVTPASLAYVADVTTEIDRGKGMGLFSAAFTLGFVISPGVGGYLAEFGLRVPFYVASVIAVAATLVTLIFLPESLSKEQQFRARNAEKSRESLLQGLKKSFKTSYFILLLLVFIMTFGLSNFEAMFSLYVDQKYGYTPKDIATLMTIGAIVGVIIQALFINSLLTRFGAVKLINISFFFAAFFMIIILLSGNFWYILLMNIMFIIFTSILRPAINTLLSNMAGDEQGFVAGMNNAYMSLGNIIGPALAGILYDIHYNIPYSFGAVILLGGLFMCVTWNRKEARKVHLEQMY
jgi:MFS transporter, DHA1 family, multidrug resistance protein